MRSGSQGYGTVRYGTVRYGKGFGKQELTGGNKHNHTQGKREVAKNIQRLARLLETLRRCGAARRGPGRLTLTFHLDGAHISPDRWHAPAGLT